MTAGGLAVELESECLQLSRDFAITEARKTAHSGGYHDRVIAPLGDGGKRDRSAAFAASLDDLPGHVPGDIQSFGNSTNLRYQPR